MTRQARAGFARWSSQPIDAVKAQAGVQPWPQNAMRHSYGCHSGWPDATTQRGPAWKWEPAAGRFLALSRAGEVETGGAPPAERSP